MPKIQQSKNVNKIYNHNQELSGNNHPNLKERSGLVSVSFPELKHCEVVEGFSVTIVCTQGQPEALKRKVRVSKSKCNVPDIVPNIG